MGDGQADGPEQDPDPSDAASTILRRGFIPLPSWFDPGRYRPLSPGSSRPAWLLGTGGLLIPLLSVAGAFSGYRAARRGNRAGTMALVWCVVTASISIVYWGPILLGGTWTAPTTYVLEASALRSGVQPPAGLGFAASEPTASYAELDLVIRSGSEDSVPFSPSSIEVRDQSGHRLAWATDDASFLDIGELTAEGSQQVHIWVALPAGRTVSAIEVGDTRLEL